MLFVDHFNRRAKIWRRLGLCERPQLTLPYPTVATANAEASWRVSQWLEFREKVCSGFANRNTLYI